MKEPEIVNWHEVKSIADLPTDDRRVYWTRMKDGRVVRLSFRNGNWVTWNSFWDPNTDPLALVVAWAPYVSKSPTTPEEKREYDRRNRQEAKERRERERQAWIDAGRPRKKLFNKKVKI